MDGFAFPILGGLQETWKRTCAEGATGASEYHVGGITVLVMHTPVSFPAGTHSHEEYEFMMPLSETFESVCDGKRVATEKRKFTPFNPWQAHGTPHAVTVNRAVALLCPKAVVEQVANEAFGRRTAVFENRSFKPSDNLRFLLGMLLEEAAAKRDAHSAMEALLVRSLLIELIRSAHGVEEKRSALADENIGIRLAVDYLSQESDEPFSLDEAAAVAGMSPYYFIRCFKKLTGTTPYQYHLTVRVERAKALLDDKSKSITEVALETGFASSSRFSTVFRKFTGFSPSAYRLRLR